MQVADGHLHSEAGLKARLYENRPHAGRRNDSVEADLKARLPKSWRQYRPPTSG
jgi:hypothetical protein